MRHSTARLLSLAALLALAAPAFASGPNLLLNPNFTSTINGWVTQYGVWSSTDVHGEPHSGSLRDTTAPGISPSFDGQCVEVAPGPYVQSASVLLEGAPDDVAFIATLFFASTDCSDLPQSQLIASTVSPGGWSRIAGTAVAPAGARSAAVTFLTARGASTDRPITAYWDATYFGTGACAESIDELCLNQGRFKVIASYAAGAGNSGLGRAVPFAEDSGSFWFFAPTNIEVDVKVLNACGVNNRYWFFAAGLTNVAVDLSVTDTKTGASKVYHNANGHVFSTITDTEAFATCP